jgi:glycosyltransferase involved in cell wall biosynthesis
MLVAAPVMKSVPFISVIINTYNGAGTIARTIESFKSQDYPGDCFEIIVADDGSSDDTAEVAQAHGALVVRLPVNRGISAARNAGLGLAKGSIILATDDDCVALPDLLRQIAAGYQSPDIMGVGSFLIPSRQSAALDPATPHSRHQ